MLILLLLVLVSCTTSSEKEKNEEVKKAENKKVLPELKLKSVKQLKTETDTRFDLSGICRFNDSLFIIADKAWNKAIYKIDTSSTKVNIIGEKEICSYEKNDFEGIESAPNGFYIINERKSEVYFRASNNCITQTLNINWKKQGFKINTWSNKGLEGIAFDAENKLLYFIKERLPRRIIRFDLKTGKLSEPFASLFDENINDFTDAKYENGKLYLLERNNSSVLRIDTETKEIKRVSAKGILNPNNQRLYETDHLEYGTAEALLLTQNEIWIGIDNNGETVSDYGQTLGLDKTNEPAIIIFERPTNF